MKKFTLITLLSALSLISASSFADDDYYRPQGGGFNGQNGTVTTVAAAKNVSIFSDDTPIVLTGYIKQSLGGETYLFADSTGTIKVEIDHDDWYGINATPDTKVTISGEVDLGFTGKRIDVDFIRLG